MLAVVIIVAICAAVIATVLGENLVDVPARHIPPFGPAWFAVLAVGLAVVATGFIFASFGVGLAGAVVLFLVWRISERA